MDQPIACSLSPAEYRTRVQSFGQIADAALRSREPREDGVRLAFEATDATERALRDLIAAESRCSPFLEFALERDGDTLTLDVTGPPDAQPIIAELMA